VWWPWALLAVVLIGGGILLARRRGKATWAQKATTTLDEIDALARHLAALTPEGVRAVAAVDAATLAGLRARLTDLVAHAPAARQQAELGELTAPLEALHRAVDSAALTTPTATADPGAAVAPLAAGLHTASTNARAHLATDT
jgi:hypothetical protein